MSPARRYWLGVFAGCVSGYLLVLLAWVLARHADETGNIIYPSLFIVPTGMGFIAEIVWKPLAFGRGQLFKHSGVVTLFSCAGAAIVFHEGAVCLVMAAPLLWLFVYTGAAIGREYFRRSPEKMNLVVLPLFLIAFVGDVLHPSEKTSEVVDELLIHAPPEKVFPFVVEFPVIREASTHWLHIAGLPEPVQSTSEGPFVGASRQCIFSNGLIFQERITELVPNQRLTFTVTEQPRDPELLGHFFLNTGQFELRDNHDGTTTLIGRSWYTLRVAPNWYFDLWTKDIVRHVHLRVMQHIAHLAEQ